MLRPACWLYVVLVLLALSCQGSQARVPDSPLRLGPDQGIVRLEPHTLWLHDPDGTLSLEDVRARAESGDFQRLPKDRSTFGYRDGALWFHFSATNLGPGRERWIFAIEYALLDHVALYRIDPDGRLTERLSGDRTPFASRDLALRNLNFELMLPPGQATDFYLRVVSESSIQVPMVLARPDAYMQSLLPGHIGLGLYYGIQIALLMYNLILWISVRDRNFLWYVLYAGTLGMLLLALNGLAFQYLWPQFPDWANLAIPIGIALSNLCMLQFSRSFLELARHAPRADRLLRASMLAAGAPLVAAWLLPYRVVIQYQTVLALLLAPIILAAAVSCLRRYAPARYFTVAWSALLLGVMVYAAVSLGLLPKTPLTEYSMQIGSATEMILLSFALAYRINLLKAENERIQGEAREQLEARVRARTAELNATLGRLEDANRRLQDFSRRDGLTGLFNRRHLDDLLVQHCQQAREKVQPLSLLMLDMDHFKRINDLSGHLTGDDCLRAMAQLIERKASAVGGIAARYGGEEFAIVLPNTGLDATRAFAEELRAETRRLRIDGLATGLESLSVSIGLHASPPGYPCNAANMLRLADSALYAAKRGGRDRVEVASLV